MKNVLICEERHALHRINDKSNFEVQVYTHQNNFSNFCEFQTFHQNQIWIELYKPNNWVFAFKDWEHPVSAKEYYKLKISLSKHVLKRILTVLPAINIDFDKLVNNSKHALVLN